METKDNKQLKENELNDVNGGTFTYPEPKLKEAALLTGELASSNAPLIAKDMGAYSGIDNIKGFREVE